MDEMQRNWEERYASGGLRSPDGDQPHPEVVALLDRLGHERAGRAPTALDLGAGAGRHTMALARAGYVPTAVDFSPTAVRLLSAALAEDRLPGRALVADLRSWSPGQEEVAGPVVVPARFDLVLGAYVHDDLSLVGRAAQWVAPGGRLLWITHAPDSGDGPPPAVHRPGLEETVAALTGTGLDVVRAEQVATTETALDVVVEAARPR